jgi:hypothetical protein
MKLKKCDRALLELLSGILVFGITAWLIGMFLPFHRVKMTVGLWGGVLVACFSAVHMWKSLQKAFLCDEKTAVRVMSGGYIIRYLVSAVYLALLLVTDAGYVLAGFAGIMALKAGAYLQPFVHKYYNWLFQEEDPVPMPCSEEAAEDGEK